MSEKKRWKLINHLGYAITIFLMVYVLSVGPVVGILHGPNGAFNNPEIRLPVRAFYAPLSFVVTRNNFLHSLAIKYTDFWLELFNSSPA